MISPMQSESFHLELTSLSDPGRVRALNEDAVAVSGEYRFAVIADGMGGHRAGDVASHMALDWAVECLSTQAHAPTAPELAAQIINEANRAIHTKATQQLGYKGMGTTLAMAIFGNKRITLAHVGDSRVYRLRNGQLTLLTRDDSMLNDQIELGLIAAQDASESHNRHMVTQALGNHPQVTAHVQEEDLCNGDVYLLCTDGLTDLIDEKDIEHIIDSLKTNLPLLASHLVQLANDCGGYDNVTVALARVLDTAPPALAEKSLMQRLFDWLGL